MSTTDTVKRKEELEYLNEIFSLFGIIEKILGLEEERTEESFDKAIKAYDRGAKKDKLIAIITEGRIAV